MHHVRAGFHCRKGHFRPAYSRIFEDAFVDNFFDVGHLRRRQRRAVEIEGQLVRSDKRTLLRRVATHHLVQRPVQQMRDGVMALNRGAAGFFNGQCEL